jgi:hypothetical protein
LLFFAADFAIGFLRAPIPNGRDVGAAPEKPAIDDCSRRARPRRTRGNAAGRPSAREALMRSIPTLVVCASLGIAACSSPQKDEAKPAKNAEADAAKAESEEKEEDELDVRDLAAEAKVSLGQALETAMHAYPAGDPVAAELEGDAEGGKRNVAFETAFVNAQTGEVFVVKVDHVTRKVISAEKEEDAGEAKEATERRAAAGAHHLPLLDLLHRAAKDHGGTPVAVAFGRKRAGVVKATFVKDREVTSVTLDAATGKTVDAK